MSIHRYNVLTKRVLLSTLVICLLALFYSQQYLFILTNPGSRHVVLSTDVNRTVAVEHSFTRSTRVATQASSNATINLTNFEQAQDPVFTNTLVTAYYNLHNKNGEQLLQWAHNLLSVQDPVIFFTAPESMPLIQQMCAKRGVNNTLIIAKNVSDFLVSRIVPDEVYWSTVMNSYSGFSNDVWKIWFEKTSFVQQAIEINPFHTDFFTWMDVGYLRNNHLNGEHVLKYLPEDQKDDTVIIATIPSGEAGYIFTGAPIAGSIRAHARWNNTYYALFKQYVDSNDAKLRDDQNLHKDVCMMLSCWCVDTTTSTPTDPWFLFADMAAGITPYNKMKDTRGCE